MKIEIIITLFCALMSVFVVFGRGTVGAIFSLVLVVLGVGGIYFYLGAAFLSIVQILLFVGLAVVLYLFAFMLMQETPKETRRVEWKLGLIIGMIFIFVMFLCMLFILEGNASLLSIEKTKALFENLLFKNITQYHSLTFEFIMLVVLSAIVAIVFINFENKKEGK